MVDKPEKLLYNISELQSVLGMGKTLLYELVKNDTFPKITINGRYYFPKAQIEKWVVQNTGKAFTLKK